MRRRQADAWQRLPNQEEPMCGVSVTPELKQFHRRWTMTRNRKSGFTLVEILIVVIILGILAAIVIPQFTNASQDARKNSLTSQLQTMRSQIELFKLQHLDTNPNGLNTAGSIAAATAWAEMLIKTNADQTTTGTPNFGPYLQGPPSNPLNGSTKVFVVTADVTLGAAATGVTDEGWIFNKVSGKSWGTSAKFGYVYNEGNAGDPNNDL
jgi:general secretion pathway protein G